MVKDHHTGSFVHLCEDGLRHLARTLERERHSGHPNLHSGPIAQEKKHLPDRVVIVRGGDDLITPSK